MNATIDHMVSLIVFIGAILLFIGLFSQTIQTAVVYESHKALSTKTSDLLDTILLNPGIPGDWGKTDVRPAGLGLQDPEFTQYQMSSFSLMRLDSSTGNLVEYDKTGSYYSNLSLGFGASLLMPKAQELNYSTALSLLGINNTYGFQLTLTPDITVSITETNPGSPLGLSVSASGTGSPFSGATINYCLIQVTLPQNESEYPSYTIQSGSNTTDQQGIANLTFPSVTDANQTYAFIAYAHLDGVVGVGYHTRVSATDQCVVPIVQSMGSQEVALAHNYDLNNSGPEGSSLKYNATFVISTEDYTLSELSLGNSSSQGVVGTVTSGVGNPSPTIPLPECTTGILIVTYQESSTQGGVVLMPWGVSSLAFPVTFGGNPVGQVWVATDIRQVTIGGIAYQAKLALWSTSGYQVNG
jgi:hypothetical protein